MFTRKPSRNQPLRTQYRMYRTVFPTLPRWVAALLALA
jgi:hypothetical protein